MDADELGNDTSLLVCRCSVFPKFLVSYEELIEKVDGIDNMTKERYRGQFGSFLEDLLSSYLLYVSDGNSETITEVSEITTELVVNLTEKCAVNLFVPELNVIMIGHDDYGFILVTDIKNKCMSYISKKLEQYVLYLVKPESKT